jgi:hypothetical protein
MVNSHYDEKFKLNQKFKNHAEMTA